MYGIRIESPKAVVCRLIGLGYNIANRSGAAVLDGIFTRNHAEMLASELVSYGARPVIVAVV